MSIPYLPLYVADYEQDTMHLSAEEDGFYNRLLRLCWRTPGCSVPDDEAWLKRRLRASDEEWVRVVRPVIEEFFKGKKGRLFSPRLQREHERINDTHQKRSDAGKKGGRPAKPLKNGSGTKSRASAAKSKTKAGPKQLELEPEPDKRGETNVSPADVLANAVSRPVADKFVEHRNGLRKPLTVHAAELVLGKLDGHHDPEAVLLESIQNGWSGVFPEKVKPALRVVNGGSNDRQQFDRAINELAERLSDGTARLDNSERDPFAARRR